MTPVGQHSLYSGNVAWRKSWNAGLLNGVMPPSTNTLRCLGFGLRRTSSAGKKVGAAVLARITCQTGVLLLSSSRVGSLYFAAGLELSGHGESVSELWSTARSSVLRAAPKAVSLPNWSWSTWARPAAGYL